ncbi:hypothetical protein GCM10025857_14300 [Alicyclobacillus contaminans]|nr:hypothetical protein GCM10025857_14300 [Alicyclobacillus contaminans]
MMRGKARKTLHPFALLVGFVALFGAVCALRTLGGIAVDGLCAVGLVWRMVRSRRSLGFLLRLAVPLVLIYTLVGCWFVRPGEHIWWQGPALPLLGSPAVSVESIARALIQSIRLWSLLLLFSAFSEAATEDVISAWFGRRYARVGLTVAMVIRLIPTLLEERQRLAEWVWLQRGGDEGTAMSRVRRMRAQATVYQALLMTALERGWQMAESMYVRGYGHGRRTVFRIVRWRRWDTAIVFGAGVLLACAVGRLLMVSAERTAWAEAGLAITLAVYCVWLGRCL